MHTYNHIAAIHFFTTFDVLCKKKVPINLYSFTTVWQFNIEDKMLDDCDTFEA